LNILKLVISFKGRLSREKFLLLVILYIFSFIALVAFSAENSKSKAMVMIEIVIGIFLFISYISSLVRRSHDFNQSGFDFFSRVIIPLDNIKVMYQLFTTEGFKGKNDYGMPN
jgi:uncharacterized membrane protein YhaH (DUF805 family)